MSVLKEMREILGETSASEGKKPTPTPAQVKKLNALRADADQHNDTKTVELVDLALAGDAAALARLKVAGKEAKAAATGLSSTRAPSRKPRTYGAQVSHPWSTDED